MNKVPKEIRVALIGGGGKMGSRTSLGLARAGYQVMACDKGEAGLNQIRDNGFEPVDSVEAVAEADFVVLAVPDRLTGTVTAALVPGMRPNATVLLLDPAAAYLGEVTIRPDCSFVVAHPCHPALFSQQLSVEAFADHFGGGEGIQDIVIALHSGEPVALDAAEPVAKAMFSPVDRCHRMNVEAMAILEPATVEMSVGAAIRLMREAMDEAVRRGVPADAARSFVLGHIKVISAVIFGDTEFPLSDAAQVAVDIGYERIVKQDWRRLFEPDEIKRAITSMLGVE